MINTFTQIEALYERLAKGNVEVEELRQGILDALDNKAMIQAQINKAYTIAQLKNKMWHRGNKKSMVIMYYQQLVFSLVPSDSFSWEPFSESWDDAIRRYANKITQDDITSYSAKIQAKRQERKEQVEGFIRALEYPQSLADFKVFLKHKSVDQLTDEQLAEYDLLYTLDLLEREAKEREKAAQIAQVEVDGLVLTVSKEYHTKKLVDIWVVKANKRVERDEYKRLAASAKKLGGFWSRWSKGFVFWNEEDANKFAGVTKEDQSAIERWDSIESMRQERAKDRLLSGSEKRSAEAYEMATKDRLTNTVRRAKHAEYAMQEADSLNRVSDAYASVAKAIESDDYRLLDRVRYGVQVELLERLSRSAKAEWVRSQEGYHYGMYEKEMAKLEIPLEAIRHVKYPWPTVREADALRYVKQLRGKRGAPAARSALRRCKRINNDVIVLEGWETCKDLEGLASQCYFAADYKRLGKMGIKSLPHLRAVLREYLQVRDIKPSIVDKVKLMELDLVGRKIAGFFPTPQDVAKRVIELANIQEGDLVLEPSAGSGRLADAARDAGGDVLCCEVNSILYSVLCAKRHSVDHCDFIEDFEHSYFDAVVMNPPFENNKDIEHVKHAYNFLRDGGRLVAIISNSARVNADRFKEWLDDVGGWFEDQLPAGTFKDSGTNVVTNIIVIDKVDNSSNEFEAAHCDRLPSDQPKQLVCPF